VRHFNKYEQNAIKLGTHKLRRKKRTYTGQLLGRSVKGRSLA